MTTWLPRWSACLVLALPFVPVVVAAPDDAEIAHLIKQMGHDEFDKREEATTRLMEIGEPALDALDKAATSGDAEVRRRAKDLVTVLEHKLYGPELLLTGHAGVVWSVAVSADGKRLLTGGQDMTLRLWDAYTGKEQRVFEGHTNSVNGAVLSADGSRVLSASTDGTVRLWDAATGKELHNMTGHGRVAQCVAFGPEGKAISGGWDNTMHLWDLTTGKKGCVFTGHTVYVYKVAYSDKAKLAATSCGGASIRLWDLETGQEVRRLSGGKGVCFSPDGKRLLSWGYDDALRLWDVESGKELKRIPTPKPQGSCAALSPDGKRIVSGSLDGTVRVWDAATGKELRKYACHAHYVVDVTFFPNGKRIASASYDGTVRIWRSPR